MKILIVANGDRPVPARLADVAKKVDYILAADGGAVSLLTAGVVPHYVIGDFDSLPKETIQQLEAKGSVFQTFDPEKNYSDHELASEFALKLGATEIIFAGLLGGRIEYTITNVLFCTDPRFAGIKLTILEGKTTVIEILHGPDSRVLTPARQTSFSLVPLTPQVHEVSLRGSKWTLERATLQIGLSLPLSNEFDMGQIDLSIASGTVMVVYQSSEN